MTQSVATFTNVIRPLLFSEGTCQPSQANHSKSFLQARIFFAPQPQDAFPRIPLRLRRRAFLFRPPLPGLNIFFIKIWKDTNEIYQGGTAAKQQSCICIFSFATFQFLGNRAPSRNFDSAKSGGFNATCWRRKQELVAKRARQIHKFHLENGCGKFDKDLWTKVDLKWTIWFEALALAHSATFDLPMQANSWTNGVYELLNNFVMSHCNVRGIIFVDQVWFSRPSSWTSRAASASRPTSWTWPCTRRRSPRRPLRVRYFSHVRELQGMAQQIVW